MNKCTPIAAVVLGLGPLLVGSQTAITHSPNVPAASAPSHQKSLNTVRLSAQSAIQTHPEVQYRWALLQAARSEQDVARGVLRPRLDVNLDAGKHWRDDAAAGSLRFNQYGGGLMATQLLWDGDATRNEIARLGHQAQARYYEFIDAASNMAAEAARAHLDVMRYRDLVRLATDSYLEHKKLLDQIEARVNAGAGRRVDLDQALGRLALAESNVRTELANLHDVSARYQRIVGSAPSQELEPIVAIESDTTTDISALTNQALRRNAGFLAAVKTVDAVRAQVDQARSRLNPRLELRARTDRHRVNDFGREPSASAAVEVVFNMNLYRGGADHAFVRQQANQLMAAEELRDKSCRDIRQTLAIAHNDVQRLRQQLANLIQHRQSTETVRRAYRQQFDIGQRSLLDLLDTENEYLQSSRAAVEGHYSLQHAYLRVHASSGSLLDVLSISRDGFTETASETESSSGAYAGCPVDVIVVPDFRASTLNLPARVAATAPVAAVYRASSKAIAASDASEHVIPPGKHGKRGQSEPTSDPAGTDAPQIAVQGADAQSAQPASAGSPEASIDRWMTAWEGKDIRRYLAFYSEHFDPSRGHYGNGYTNPAISRKQWEAQRIRALSKPGVIEISRRNTHISYLTPKRVQVRFEQDYRSPDFADTVVKTLDLEQSPDGQWLIRRETSQVVHGGTLSTAGTGNRRKV